MFEGSKFLMPEVSISLGGLVIPLANFFCRENGASFSSIEVDFKSLA